MAILLAKKRAFLSERKVLFLCPLVQPNGRNTQMTNNLKTLIDDLGALKAQIAELTLREKEIKAALDDLAPGAYEGEQFRLSISDSVRCTLDMDAVREKLSPQFITAHTRETPVRTIKVVARNGKKLAA
jgi:hypothetical protein